MRIVLDSLLPLKVKLLYINGRLETLLINLTEFLALHTTNSWRIQVRGGTRMTFWKDFSPAHNIMSLCSFTMFLSRGGVAGGRGISEKN